MAHAPGTDQMFYVGTMDGWYLDTKLNSVAIGAHWSCFIVLTITTFYLGYESWTSRGPSKRTSFYAGYQEEQNLALFVNFFAMLSYFGKIVADTLGHNFGDVGPFIIGFGNYRYADYMLTCPMLVYDLLYQLRAPYRVSCSAIIFAILMSGVLAEFYAEGDPRLRNGAYAWYGFGCFWFIFAYSIVMSIVAKQYSRLAQLAQDTGAEHSLHVLKFAVFTFSMLWILFPLVWAICPRGFGWIDDNWTEVAHCVCDIVAKSCYGFALARFRKTYDEELFRLLEQLGHDEDEFQKLELDMRLSSNGERLRRLSQESYENRGDDDTLTPKKAYIKGKTGAPLPKHSPKTFPSSRVQDPASNSPGTTSANGNNRPTSVSFSPACSEPTPAPCVPDLESGTGSGREAWGPVPGQTTVVVIGQPTLGVEEAGGVTPAAYGVPLPGQAGPSPEQHGSGQQGFEAI